MTPIRLAFCGSSGTGKSTLASRIAKHLGAPQNPVGSRSVSIAMGFASPYDVDAAGKRAEFQRRLIVDKIAWENDQETFVTDRTPLDNLLYTMLHDITAVDEEMVELVRRGLSRYTCIVYCPVRVFCRVGEDTARVKSPAYQAVFDAALVGLIATYAEPENVLTLASDDLEERVDMVRAYIGG